MGVYAPEGVALRTLAVCLQLRVPRIQQATLCLFLCCSCIAGASSFDSQLYSQLAVQPEPTREKGGI